MTEYDYVIIGGGLAGASAIEGIRESDDRGSILLVCAENQLPYDRPPLSKKLWFGKTRVDEIFLHDRPYYDQRGVTVILGVRADAIDAKKKTVRLSDGTDRHYRKLLLATGGTPKRLAIPGGDIDGICYFRTLDDYLRTRGEASEGKSALIVGGGFIGSELAAALNTTLEITMVFPSATVCNRVFPESLGLAIQRHYHARGIRVLASDTPMSISRVGGTFRTEMVSGKSVESDLLLVGIGIEPSIELARQANLTTDNGIVVNTYLETSDPDIYAAGDNAHFPYQALGKNMRVEHWDNALAQGKLAGRNMAGAREAFTYMPYFFSDLFEFGYEAVGEVDASLDMVADWQKENHTGVIYYLRDDVVRGVMMCNLWDRLDVAREMILKAEPIRSERLRGAIR